MISNQPLSIPSYQTYQSNLFFCLVAFLICTLFIWHHEGNAADFNLKGPTGQPSWFGELVKLRQLARKRENFPATWKQIKLLINIILKRDPFNVEVSRVQEEIWNYFYKNGDEAICQEIFPQRSFSNSDDKATVQPELRPRFQYYHVIFSSLVTQSGTNLVGIRKFSFDDITFYIGVEPDSLMTKVLLASEVIKIAPPDLENTKYGNALNQFCQGPYPIENYGIKEGSSREKGVFLTVDLCPSDRGGFEKQLFDTLIDLPQGKDAPIPVAVAITAYWGLKHFESLQWLKDQEKRGKLAITWVNHSFSHKFIKRLPYAENFLLLPGTDLCKEILTNEMFMLENGLIPSIFFRFPGLVSNEKLNVALQKFHLLPLGANAWLGKGEIPRGGSIILVHGNGNEPLGVRLFYRFLEGRNFGPANQGRLLPLKDLF